MTWAVLYPLPVMQTTMDSSFGIAPAFSRLMVAARVVPPAGSVKMPSVRASRAMASRISASVARAPVPPLPRTVWSTWCPSAGLPMAIDFAMVAGRTGSGYSAPLSRALTTGAHPAACAACIFGSSPSASPTSRSSRNARPMRGSRVPPATGETRCRG